MTDTIDSTVPKRTVTPERKRSAAAVTATAMSVQDALWLTMDRPNNLMVVDGAMVLTGPVGLAAARKEFERGFRRFPVFGRRAVAKGAGWVWQDDPDFTLDRHVTEATLSGNKDMAALQEFLAERRTEPLPDDRPLWRAYVIPEVRLPDGSLGSAVVSRFHHAIADGVRLTQVMLGLCEGAELAPPVTVATEHHRPRPTELLRDMLDTASSGSRATVRAARDAAGSSLAGVAAVLRDPARAVHLITGFPRGATRFPGTVRESVATGLGYVRHPDQAVDVLDALGVSSHRTTHDMTSVTKIALTGNTPTIWTGTPGTAKAIAWSEPIPLSLVKDIGHSTGTTVNDVLLTAVAGGLQAYLARHNATLAEVNWMVPVNLKPFADNLPPDLGNYFALVFLPMPLSIEDPLDRLAHVHERMARIKESDEAVLTFGLQRIVSQSPAQIAFALTNFFANKAVGVLTNVPGPRSLMTFAGVPVRQVIGFAPCSGDQPMTTTIFSYNGEVTVGFASDAGLVPEPRLLADLVVEQLQILATAAGVAPA